MPETAKRTARVPILGEDGRISDDYVPAAIGEGVESAEAAAKRAETAATDAKGSATAASQSAAQASGSASAASTSATQAQESATTAGGAVTQAQSAQRAAEAAKTGAESARDSAKTAASQAQQSATAAAESAANVADKFISSAQATTLEPGSQATASVADQVLTLGIPRGDKGDKGDQGDKGDPGDVSAVQTAEGSDLSVSTDGGTVTIDDSALRERIAELENQAANVLTGTATGKVAHAEDAYATKPRKLTVQGKTRQNLWVNPSGTINGVTVTSNADGSFTMSGTSTGAINLHSLKSYALKPGSSYYFEYSPSPSNFSVGISQYINGAFKSTKLMPSGGGVITIDSDVTEVTCVICGIDVGTTVSGTYRVMLNEGSTAKPWCPPGLNSVGELSIVTAGKNLFSTMATATIGGITLEKQEDGGYHIYGTSTQQVQFITEQYVEFPEGSYTISGGKASKVMAWTYKADKSYIGPMVSDNGKSVTFDVSRDNRSLVTLLIQVEKSTSVDEIIYPQFELGSTATAYEPPTVTTTPIDLDGNTLCSLPDGTHDELTIDATGAVTLTKRTWSDVFDGTENWQDSTNRYGLDNGITFDAAPDSVIRDKQMADTLPVIDAVGGVNGIRAHASKWVDANIASMQGDLAGFKAWLGNNNTTLIYKLAEPQTIPLPPVTLPTLPAPTVNVWADAESSGTGYAMGPDAEMEYERDVTIAFNKLQAQISATTVREATNG